MKECVQIDTLTSIHLNGVLSAYINQRNITLSFGNDQSTVRPLTDTQTFLDLSSYYLPDLLQPDSCELDVQHLHQLHLHTIKHQLRHQKPNERVRRPDQLQRMCKRRDVGEQKPDQHNRHRCRHQDFRGAALEHGDLGRAQKVHDEGLS